MRMTQPKSTVNRQNAPTTGEDILDRWTRLNLSAQCEDRRVIGKFSSYHNARSNGAMRAL